MLEGSPRPLSDQHNTIMRPRDFSTRCRDTAGASAERRFRRVAAGRPSLRIWCDRLPDQGARRQRRSTERARRIVRIAREQRSSQVSITAGLMALQNDDRRGSVRGMRDRWRVEGLPLANSERRDENGGAQNARVTLPGGS